MPKQKKNKLVIGITGNIGSGKSMVAGMFKAKDTLIIDADKLGHKLFSVDSSVYKRIKRNFGEKIIKKNNCIDRAKLGKIVFNHKAQLVKLNSIVHPEIISKIKQQIKNTSKKIVILDAPLIIEAGLRNFVDKLIVVKAKKNQQILRKLKKSGLSKADIIKRMKFQISPDEKYRFADFIIDNTGSIRETKKQIKLIRRMLWKS